MKIRKGSMSERALRVMYRQGWLSAMAIGDLLDLASDDNASDRNTLSATISRLCKAGIVERRVVERWGSCGSRYEYRIYLDGALVAAQARSA